MSHLVTANWFWVRSFFWCACFMGAAWNTACHPSNAAGLLVGLGSNASTFYAAPSSDISITLTLTNDDASTIDLLVTQFSLCVAAGGAPEDEGDISIASVTSIGDALFAPSIPFLTPLLDRTFIQTAGVPFPVPIPEAIANGVTRNLFQLDLTVSSNALGTHYLYMHPFDPFDFNSSSAMALLGEPLIVPYGNAALPEHANRVLLATFKIAEPLLGDYDGNGVVDAEDYQLWKDSFGQSIAIPGNDADGNQDGIVNLADYVVWRDHLGAGNPPEVFASPSYAPVPEMAAGRLAGLVCLLGFLLGPVMKSRNSRSVMGCAAANV